MKLESFLKMDMFSKVVLNEFVFLKFALVFSESNFISFVDSFYIRFFDAY